MQNVHLMQNVHIYTYSESVMLFKQWCKVQIFYQRKAPLAKISKFKKIFLKLET